MGRLCPLVLALLVCSGCGGKKTIPVTGRVVFADGTPLAEGLVVFNPVVDADKLPTPDGVIQSDGTFKMRTYSASDGVLPGKYRVAIVVPPPPEGEPPRLDPKFAQGHTSGFEADVQPGEKNDFTFTVHPPPAPAPAP
jgi:hypothetical protein